MSSSADTLDVSSTTAEYEANVAQQSTAGSDDTLRAIAQVMEEDAAATNGAHDPAPRTMEMPEMPDLEEECWDDDIGNKMRATLHGVTDPDNQGDQMEEDEHNEENERTPIRFGI